MSGTRFQRVLLVLAALPLLAAVAVVANNLDDPGVEALPDRPTTLPTPAAVPSVLPRPELPNLERLPLDATATNLPIPFPTRTPIPGVPTAPALVIPLPPTGPCARFESSDWGVSFEYPSSWALSEARGPNGEFLRLITLTNVPPGSLPSTEQGPRWVKVEVRATSLEPGEFSSVDRLLANILDRARTERPGGHS